MKRKQESLQNIADVYLNVEMKVRDILQALSSLCLSATELLLW